MLLLNAFSANMLQAFPAECSFVEQDLEQARALAHAGIDSAVGHAETAAIFGDQLGCTVLCQRITVALKRGDRALLGQYRGPRLPEGAMTLPAGATIQWLLVTIA